MKFKLDENLPIEAAGLLRQAGYDAMTILEQRMGGFPDSQVSLVCREENRVLLTLDLDFSNIQSYPPHAYPGIVVFRLPKQDKATLLHLVSHVLPYFSKESLHGRLWIVDEQKIRIRE